MAGFCAVLDVPSPKVHTYDAMLPVDVLVKLTASGAVPLTGVAVNDATGAAALVVAEATGEYAPRLPAASTARTR